MATSEVNTSVRPEGLRSAAKEIGEIVDDFLVAVPKLADVEGNAGEFEVATWLEHLNQDRQDAMAGHVTHLRKTLEDVKAGLIAIADAFAGLDENNADAVAKAGKTALESIKKMDETDIPPLTTNTWLADYDTKSDEDPKDEDTFKDGKVDIDALNRDDLKHLGLEETLKKDGLGPDNKSTLDLTDTLVDGKEPEKSEEKKEEASKSAPLGETGTHAKEDDQDADRKTYRHYDIDGGHQRHNGNDIWWTERKAYIADGDNPSQFAEYSTQNAQGGQDGPPQEKGDHDDDDDKDWGGDTYRYYTDDAGNQTTHNGNKVWWLNGDPYLKAVGGGFVPYSFQK